MSADWHSHIIRGPYITYRGREKVRSRFFPEPIYYTLAKYMYAYSLFNFKIAETLLYCLGSFLLWIYFLVGLDSCMDIVRYSRKMCSAITPNFKFYRL